MSIFVVLRYLVVALLVGLVITEMLIPVLHGRPMFPMFRRESELRKKLQEAKQEQYEASIEQEIDNINKTKESE
jgi:hypothetical protein